MKVVIDEDLHRSLSEVLLFLNFQIYDIRDYRLRGKPDEIIYKFAQKKKAVLFSGDLGFANILHFPLGTHQGIVILRFPNELSTTIINREIKDLLAKVPKNLYSGNLIILSPRQIRIKEYKKYQ